MQDGVEIVCRALASTGRLPPGGPDRIATTHISSVILTGDRAYKVKKPVRFPFVDYSTVALRRYYCHAELALGARFSPELYLGVLEVPDASGAPAESAVMMRRFPDEALLDARAGSGLLDDAVVDALALEVARVHALCPEVPPARALVQLERQQRSFDHDFVEMRAMARTGGERDALERIAARVEAERIRIAPQLSARAATGFVREAHGDLHLGNLIWLEGRPRLFDPIEFNDDFRLIDVAADLAFLAMDLAARGLEEQSERLVERYVAATGDPGLPGVLRYHVTQRALVRAKVAMIRREAVPPGRVLERERVESELNRYLGLVLDERRPSCHTPGYPAAFPPSMRPSSRR